VKYLISLISLCLITACVKDRQDIMTQHERPSDVNSVSVITGKSGGTSVLELGKSSSDSSVGLPVNALLWRAALDIASYVPLDDVDTFGGSVVTEWYVPENQPNKRLKLAVFVIGRELRSDAIQVRAYVQTRNDNSWTSVGRDVELSRKLEDLILTRARELRAATIKETSN
jgi:hypothetical protein